MVDEIYQRIEGHEPVQSGSLILLLAIIAMTTHVWVPRDEVEDERFLFWSSTQAHTQTSLWIKATYAVLNASQEGAALALETIQGVMILSFVICNLEGYSLRYRSLLSTALLLGREQGLHRIDHESNSATANTSKAEMGRRLWWYLIATDWFVFVSHNCIEVREEITNSSEQARSGKVWWPRCKRSSSQHAPHDSQQTPTSQ